MKHLALLLILLPLSLCAQQYERQQQQTGLAPNVPLHAFEQERETLFNFDWRFAPGNPEGTQQPNYDDSIWRTLHLPHDFQFELPWDESAGGARGFKASAEGWYRKRFHAPEHWQGKQVVLDFEGILYYSDVYVNGIHVGAHEYGYLGFEVDISRHLRYGEENLVAVYAHTGKPRGSRWYTGGGLYRNVWLRLQNPTHIGRHGIYVQTPHVSDTLATVRAQVEVWGFRKRATLIRATVRDAQGKAVAQTEAVPNQLTKHHHDEIPLPLCTIPKPHRWDLDTPYLYTLDVELYADSVLADRRTETFGVRTIEYSPQFGFRLNGRKVFLRGMANHHDLGGLGAAAFPAALERQLRLMKDFGFNAIRCSHNPYSPDLYRLADRLGLLVVDELIDKWSDDEYWGGRKPFMHLWATLIPEWVKRTRNSPSVVLWSLGNELQTRPQWSGYATNDWGITTYRIFDQMVKRYDRTRPTTVAQFPARAGAIREEPEFRTYFAPPELACATEVASFNYQWDCYPKYFEYEPDLILFQSEAVTHQLLAPYYGMDRDRTVGLAYWGAISYWGESNRWPKKGWDYSFFDHTLQPRPQAWLIRSAFRPEEPLVRIGVATGGESHEWNDVRVGQQTYTSFWNHPQGSRQHVVTFTNAQEVELLANGRSLGRRPNDTTDVFRRGIIAWPNTPYGQGGTLTAVAYTNGHEVARHEIVTTGPATRLHIEAERPEAWTSDGLSLLYLNVQALDRHGRQVPTFGDTLTATLQGEATLQALDNGDHSTPDLFHLVSAKPMRQGYMQVILRSTRRRGSATLRLSTPTLKATYRIPAHR